MSRPSGRALLAGTIVLLGVALRVAGIRHGLPGFDEEAAPFRWALAMWARPDGRIDWNPHHFIYPSLAVYLHLALQRLHEAAGVWSGRFAGPADYHVALELDPAPMLLLARSLGIAADAVSLALVARIGERLRPGAGLVAALLAACSPILIGTARAIQTDPLMLALALAAVERLQVYERHPGSRAAVVAGVLCGLATGAKYPALVLLLPLGWTLLAAHGARAGARVLAAALAACGLAFVATSPWLLLDHAQALRDLGFVRVIATAGILGASGSASGLRTLGSLGHDLGPVASVFALAGLGLALSRTRTPGAIILLLAGAGFLLPPVLSPLRFERYLEPAIAIAALLAGLAAAALAARVQGRTRAVAWGLVVSLLAAPALARGFGASSIAPTTTQRQALDWLLANADTTSLVLSENYGPPLVSRQMAQAWSASPLARGASPALRERLLARRWFAAVRLPALVAGTCDVTLRGPDGAAETIAVFPQAADFNAVLYDPRLLAGVDYVITSSAIRGRFAADPARYGAPCAFYRRLDSLAVVAARFLSRPGVDGPDLTIYRLPAARSFAPDTLDEWWWTDRIPRSYRVRATTVLVPGAAAPGAAMPDGGASPWTLALRPLYRAQVEFFANDLAENLLVLGRLEPARRLLRATLAIDPMSAGARRMANAGGRTLPESADPTAAARRSPAVRSAQRRAGWDPRAAAP